MLIDHIFLAHVGLPHVLGLNVHLVNFSLLQEKIDTARNYYQQLLFRYTKEMSSEDQGSRHSATLQKALKTVKDFGEKIRSFKVHNNQTKINV